ncbi:MAG: L-threonylcarbamoyladenylate synthase [Candidatus Aenigmatarchaeota archaeon]
MIIKAGRRAIDEAVKILKKGGLVIYPSESSYGIGCDATNEKAVKRIFSVKKRSGKAIPIIVSSIRMAEKYAFLSDDAKKIAERLMPGPLTLVVKKKNLPDSLSKETVGFRIPSHNFSVKLATSFGKPITATSANLSGNKPIYSIEEVIKLFSNNVDLIIDAGTLPKNKPTTVFDAGSRKILRRGPVTKKEIISALKL